MAMKPNSKVGLRIFFAFSLTFGLSSCSRKSEPAPPPAAVVSLSQELTGPVLEILAKADAHDGTVDHVVEDCASCKLHMKGRAEYSATLRGYTLHLCTDRCRQTLANDPEKVLTSLDLE